MTVISATISSSCIAVSSDSWLTQRQNDGSYRVVESEESKIVPVPTLRAALSYWGLAAYGNWSTYGWLQEMARQANGFGSLAQFADAIRDRLDHELRRMNLANQLAGGIGIHITGYERVNDYWIPELFLCCNFDGVTYDTIRPLSVTRESYHIAYREAPNANHSEPEYRLRVHEWLMKGDSLIYNNGDPIMFNQAARAVHWSLLEAKDRGVLRDPECIETQRAIVRRPVEIVSAAQRDLYKEGQRLVGGRVHDLVITPNGEFTSSSGDAP